MFTFADWLFSWADFGFWWTGGLSLKSIVKATLTFIIEFSALYSNLIFCVGLFVYLSEGSSTGICYINVLIYVLIYSIWCIPLCIPGYVCYWLFCLQACFYYSLLLVVFKICIWNSGQNSKILISNVKNCCSVVSVCLLAVLKGWS